jgi:hypothetical protein
MFIVPESSARDCSGMDGEWNFTAALQPLQEDFLTRVAKKDQIAWRPHEATRSVYRKRFASVALSAPRLARRSSASAAAK